MKRFETEQKFRLHSVPLLKKRLRHLGAKKIHGGQEENFFYDCGISLRRRRSILRLRRTEDGRSRLAFKGPRLRSKYSRRVEYETPVDFNSARALLHAVGFREIFHYAKRREEYRLANALVTIDTLARHGRFLEIEGPARVIDSIRRRLGVPVSDREDRTYLEMLSNFRHTKRAGRAAKLRSRLVRRFECGRLP